MVWGRGVGGVGGGRSVYFRHLYMCGWAGGGLDVGDQKSFLSYLS